MSAYLTTQQSWSVVTNISLDSILTTITSGIIHKCITWVKITYMELLSNLTANSKGLYRNPIKINSISLRMMDYKSIYLSKVSVWFQILTHKIFNLTKLVIDYLLHKEMVLFHCCLYVLWQIAQPVNKFIFVKTVFILIISRVISTAVKVKRHK